jgi:hypothetical protein
MQIHVQENAATRIFRGYLSGHGHHLGRDVLRRDRRRIHSLKEVELIFGVGIHVVGPELVFVVAWAVEDKDGIRSLQALRYGRPSQRHGDRALGGPGDNDHSRRIQADRSAGKVQSWEDASSPGVRAVGIDERAVEERGHEAEAIVDGHRQYAMVEEKLRLAWTHILPPEHHMSTPVYHQAWVHVVGYGATNGKM